MKTSKLSFLIVCLIISANAYKIDFQNGDNRIHLESTAVENGKIVNEPKVEEAIKTLSSFKFNSQNKDANRNMFENVADTDTQVENVENSRIFITNINKNINNNEEDTIDKEKFVVSGYGQASMVPPSPIKKTYHARPLKATRVIGSANKEDTENPEKNTNELKSSLESTEPPANLTNIVPELVQNPLSFAADNATSLI